MPSKPLISIIIPIASWAEPQLLNKTLSSISRQTYKNFETLVIISDKADKNLFKTLKKFPKTKTLIKTLGKSEAQNYGAECARGKYLLMHETDTVLKPETLKEALTFSIKNNNYPIWIPRRFETKNNYWILCRNFDFALYDKTHHANDVRFIEKELFIKLGGYDSQFDPLDDYTLLIKLLKKKIPIYSLKEPYFITIENINFLKIAHKKYLRGQAFGLIKRHYPEILSENFQNIFKHYLDNLPLFLANFYLIPGWFIIKLFNFVPLYLGILTNNTSKLNYYEADSVAEKYEKLRLGTNYGRYKHYSEIASLKKLLPKKATKVIEIGAGTGRITKFLVSKGFKVTPVEPSNAMLKQYRKKKTLPKPIKASGEKLPFNNKVFPLLVSIRVLWHLRDKIKQEQFIKEICRVCSSKIILDITNKKRFTNLLIRIPSQLLATILNINFNFDNAHLFDITRFKELIGKQGFEITEEIPLEVTIPFWLNYLETKKARKLYPWFYQLDTKLSQLIPPGRFLLKLSRKNIRKTS